jgi:hypothetical protein
MAYRTGVALHHAVRHGAVACDEAVRNAGLTMIAVGRVASGEGVGGMGLEAAHAVTASPARRGVEGMKAAATKTASGMKATATVETTTTATVETTPATTVETTATAATAMARLGYACEREPHHCARQNSSKP